MNRSLLLVALAACGGPLEEEEAEVGVAEQALTVVQVEGESMSVTYGDTVGDGAASGGAAMRIYPGGSAFKTVSVPAAGTSLVARVYRSASCTGASSALQLKVGATVVGSLNVSSTSWQTLSVPASVPAASVTLTATNQGSASCRMFLDYLIVDGPVGPPPPPVVTTYQAEDAAFTGAGTTTATARIFYANGTATRTITTTGAATYLEVFATSVRCNSNVPRVVITIDGVVRLDVTTYSGGWNLFTASLPSLPAGTHTLGIGYPNNSDVAPCDSHLDVDWVRLTTQP